MANGQDENDPTRPVQDAGGQDQNAEDGAAQAPPADPQGPGRQGPPLEVKLADDPEMKIEPSILAEIEDALNLLEFAIASGFKSTAGPAIEPATVIAIKRMAARRQGGMMKLSEWINFELHYHALAALLAPVSAETLRNTRDHTDQSSPARKFTRQLWWWTGAWASIIIVVELGLKAGGAPETPAFTKDASQTKSVLDTLMHFGQLVEPYAYGGLGACAYLLRSAHMYIYSRTFDLRRRSEYYNRIILGLVAGGAIFLFVNNTVGDDSTTVQLSSGALAFIAGYSNDFLFTAIQRIVNAIFPKNQSGDRPAGHPRAPADAPGAGQSNPLGQHGGGP